MPPRFLKSVSLLALSCGLVLGCSDDETAPGPSVCGADALAAALAEAGPGDNVNVECPTMGNFTVPAGVSIRGVGDGALSADSGDAVLTLEVAADVDTGVYDLPIRSSAETAIFARGEFAGNVIIRGVTLNVDLGHGVVLEGLDSARIIDTDVIGVATTANVPTAPDSPPLETVTSAEGLRLEFIEDLTLGGDSDAGVNVSGFASYGVLIKDSSGAWTGGTVSGSVGNGLLVFASTMQTDRVEITGTAQLGSTDGGIGLYVFDGSEVTGAGLVADGNFVGVGVSDSESTLELSDLSACENSRAGAWAQLGASLSVTGGALQANTTRGVYAVEANMVDLDDVDVGDTESFLLGDGNRIGDGVQLIDTDFALSNMTIANNERIGVMINRDELVDSPGTFSEVTVDGSGEQLGALYQDFEDNNLQALGTWDLGITRAGATSLNDVAANGALFVNRVQLPVINPDI